MDLSLSFIISHPSQNLQRNLDDSQKIPSPFLSKEVRSPSLFPLIRKGFIDKHDRDIVFNPVNQPTGLADQSISLLVQEDIPLALRTGQNLQELLAEWHPLLLSSNPLQ